MTVDRPQLVPVRPWRIMAMLIGAALSTWTSAAWPDDRHAGYYYPAPEMTEIHKARTRAFEGMTAKKRVAFVTAMMQQLIERPYPPPVAIFVKGEKKEKLIIVSNVPGRLDTIFRIRAYLASLTPIFRELGMEETLTFFDLLKMIGFVQITVSDSAAFSHQVRFE